MEQLSATLTHSFFDKLQLLIAIVLHEVVVTSDEFAGRRKRFNKQSPAIRANNSQCILLHKLNEDHDGLSERREELLGYARFAVHHTGPPAVVPLHPNHLTIIVRRLRHAGWISTGVDSKVS